MLKLTMVSKVICYIDWNIISYLFDKDLKDEKLKKSVKCFNYFLAEFKKTNNFVIPYNNAHLEDIYLGSEDFYAQKITSLKLLSDDNYVGEIPDDREKIYVYKSLALEHHFPTFCKGKEETSKSTKEVLELLGPYLDNVREYIRYQNKQTDTEELNKEVIDELCNCIFYYNDDLKNNELIQTNRKLRTQSYLNKGQKIRFPIFKDQRNKFPNKSVQEVADICIKKSDFPFDNHKELLDKFFNLIKDTPALSDFKNIVIKLCFFADLIGVGYEKKKTSFNSINNDISHLSYGLRCSIFVTEDKTLYEKATFIKEWLGLTCDIFKIDEFIEFYLRETSIVDNKSGDLTFSFNDENGNFIKSYSISI